MGYDFENIVRSWAINLIVRFCGVGERAFELLGWRKEWCKVKVWNCLRNKTNIQDKFVEGHLKYSIEELGFI